MSSLQEFEHQGFKFGGEASVMGLAGTNGKHPQNIKRDMLRRVDAQEPDTVPCFG